MKALIIIDMLNDFVHPEGSLYFEAGERIIPYIRNFLMKVKLSKDYQIIFLKDTHAINDSEFKLFPPHCVAGTWGNRIVKELGRFSDRIIVPKPKFSGFFNTDLDQILSLHYITEADVVGVCTSICVMDTVQGLFYRDIKVNVHKDMTADLTPEDHEWALRRMKNLYGANII